MLNRGVVPTLHNKGMWIYATRILEANFAKDVKHVAGMTILKQKGSWRS